MTLWNGTLIARTVKFMIAASAVVLTAGQSLADMAPGSATVKQMNVNGAALTYQEQGQGAPVVFLHGALGDYRVWGGEREAIASKHHFVALTLRYFGTAPWPDDGKNFSLATEADDVAAFIKGLKEGPVNLVGYSFSGALALLVATQHPDLVRGLFLYEPHAISIVADPAQAKAAKEAEHAMMAPVGAVMKAGSPTALAKALPGAWNAQPDYFDTLPPAGQKVVLDNARTIPLLFAGWPPPPVTCAQLGELKMPVTVARGEDTTPFYKIVTNAAARCIPDAKLVVIPNARHLAPVQDAPALNAAVLEFLFSK